MEKKFVQGKKFKKIFMHGRKKIHTPRWDRKKKFAQEENSPHPHHFSNGRTLVCECVAVVVVGGPKHRNKGSTPSPHLFMSHVK